MALLPITPPPGVKTNGTEYSNKNSWVESDLCRFENGFLTNIGGWQSAKQTKLVGTPIGMYAYYTNNDERVLAIGTREKVYVNFRDNWYDITPTGFVGDAQTSPLGFGAYNYNVEDYGDARSQSGLAFDTKPFSFDNFGENLIFCCGSDGKIYKWRPDSLSDGSYVPDSKGLQLANSPIGVMGILVTNERHIFAFGVQGNPRKIAWSSRETDNVWTASATNTAGDLIVSSGGSIQGGVKFGADVIVFTDVGIQKVYYAGSPLIYGIQEAGSNCRTSNMKTVATTGNFVAWMGDNSFYFYDGRVQKIKSDVHDFVFESCHIEVKSSIGINNRRFVINGESQLTISPEKQLFILNPVFEISDNGQSLPDLVASIKELIGSDQIAMDFMENLLAKAGYHEIHNEYYVNEGLALRVLVVKRRPDMVMTALKHSLSSTEGKLVILIE